MERLWAPWRLAYVTDDAPAPPGCFFCNAWTETNREAETLLLGRGERAFVLLNRFPYNNGHLMVAPAEHTGNMEDVPDAVGAELWRLAVVAKRVLSRAMHPDGFNVGINQGRCGGAGVLDHLHLHVVPRWDGDSNFMPVLADTKVMPQHLAETREQLRELFRAEGY